MSTYCGRSRSGSLHGGVRWITTSEAGEVKPSLVSCIKQARWKKCAPIMEENAGCCWKSKCRREYRARRWEQKAYDAAGRSVAYAAMATAVATVGHPFPPARKLQMRWRRQPLDERADTCPVGCERQAPSRTPHQMLMSGIDHGLTMLRCLYLLVAGCWCAER
jgi:hypothetical protein